MAGLADESSTLHVSRALPVPTTFGGVAALACGPWRPLIAWQITVALTSALILAWALDATWGRAIVHAAGNLPDSAEILGGRLRWPGTAPVILHHGPFLAIVVDPLGQRESALGADLTLSVEPDRLAFRSILGWLETPYPANGRLPLSRNEVLGELSAWMSPARFAAAATLFAILLLTWAVLATAYAVVVRVLSGRGGRVPYWGRAWRLCAAALLFPALLMSAAAGLYVIREIALPGLLMAHALHVVLGWVYTLGGLARIPRPTTQPFAPTMEEAPAPTPPPDNPFQCR